jgi:uncharacterized Fe-S cluster protein YjdI
VSFDAARCLHAGECVRGLPVVFDVKARPWIQPDGADADAIAEVVRRCPSGALHFRRADGSGEEAESPTTAQMRPAGGLAVRGDLMLRLPDGSELAETRATLCTCGATANAPFCDNACSRD